ncbi:DUF309 domain-containing protein [Paenibacillus sp. NPDC058071]|uniref:DUF309 domain-containing protein n=1 Tax=Paenibacillus sp. NPDC058071 TaxID=3346326 RepID=UPI0036DA6415
MNDSYPDAYIDYLVEYHATRDYFECHELLEEYWKEHPNDPRAETWVGLIQLAVGHYHLRRGNTRGASMLYANAALRLKEDDISRLGIDGDLLLAALKDRRILLQAGQTFDYTEMDMRLVDAELRARCETICLAKGLIWGIKSPMNDPALIDRHKLRDRTEVIAARAEAVERKRKSRDQAGF